MVGKTSVGRNSVCNALCVRMCKTNSMYKYVTFDNKFLHYTRLPFFVDKRHCNDLVSS